MIPRPAIALLLAATAAGGAPPLPPSTAPAAAPAAASPPPAAPDAAVARVLAGAIPFGGARADAATAPLLGRPYAASPLGEDSGPDPDPRFRLDAFDCMTFAETAVALADAPSLDEARRILDLVRYSGPPVIAARNHEVVSQWLPANVARGVVVPISRALAGPGTVRATVAYDAARWARLARAGARLPGVPPDRLPVGRFELDVVPPGLLAAVERRIPDGTLAFVVREDRDGAITRVSHVGLVVVGAGGGRLVRHASSWPGMARVIEEPLALFVRRQRRASSRRLTGLSLYAIPDARARLRGDR